MRQREWHSRRRWTAGKLSLIPLFVWTFANASQPPQDGVGTKPPRSGEIPMTIKVSSPAFEPNTRIPTKFTDDGENISPLIQWSEIPAACKELALVCDDPDAPRAEPWDHWVIYKIPFNATQLPEGVSKVAKPPEVSGAIQGRNSWDKLGYGGPAPPKGHGVHHYHFRVYALDAPLNVASGLTKKELLNAMKGHILAQGELVGTYQR